MNVRPTYSGDIDHTRQENRYVYGPGWVTSVPVADDLTHPFFYGQKYKYTWEYHVRDEEKAYLKESASELRGTIGARSLPFCFQQCVPSLQSLKLSEKERTCFVKCYMRRITSMSEMKLYYEEKIIDEKTRNVTLMPNL